MAIAKGNYKEFLESEIRRLELTEEPTVQEEIQRLKQELSGLTENIKSKYKEQLYEKASSGTSEQGEDS